jgi:hypothetical protein
MRSEFDINFGIPVHFKSASLKIRVLRFQPCPCSTTYVTSADVGDALAQFPDAIGSIVGVPSPEIGGGMVGTMVAAGVVYLINRRRSRS